MTKSTLLGGFARIVREPSHEEMQMAALRRLGAGPVINLEMSPADVARRTTPSPKPAPRSDFDIVLARETGWIADQIGKDIEALGGGPRILSVVPDKWRGWTVTMLQWNASGIGVRMDHVLKFERKSYQDPFHEGKLRRMVTTRLAKLLVRQAEQVRDLGEPRMLIPDEIDLSRFRIDKPLAAMLDQTYPDAGARMRKALATTNTDEFLNYSKDGRQAELTFGKYTVRGKFNVGANGIDIDWCKGGLSVFGADLPDTIVTGCVGRALGKLIDHPLFDGSMEIAAVHATRSGGVDGFALTLKDTMGPMPAHW